MTVNIPRETALKVLYEIHEKGAYSNISLNRNLESANLKSVDRAFITELVYGTEKWLLKIDWVISEFSSIRLKKMSPWILNIIRLGVYQMLYMDRVPTSAACNEAVKLARRYGHASSAGFVNAVLRKVAQKGKQLSDPPKSNIIKHLSVSFSYPEWMVKRFTALFGVEFTEELLAAGNQTPPFNVRANLMKLTAAELLTKLSEEGITSVHGRYCGDALILQNPSSIMKLNAFLNGLFQVQDESSMIAVRVLDPQPGEFIIDVCSAPGGKTIYAAQKMQNMGKVLARDIFDHKLELVEQAAKRAGLDIVHTQVHNAAIYDEKLVEKADRVLVDAPCSGLGIIRRKPDIKWSKEPENSESLCKLQRDILDVASKYVKPGGVLVYSTCTILPEENRQLVEAFLNSDSGKQFRFEGFTEMLPEGLLADLSEESSNGAIQLYPNKHGTDGFFVSKMRKMHLDTVIEEVKKNG